MDVIKKRVYKSYLKMCKGNSKDKRIVLFEELPLNTLIIIEKYNDVKAVIEIKYFSRKEFSFMSYLYAINIDYDNNRINRNKYIDPSYIELLSIKSWKLWTLSFVPLTINWTMSDWYKTMAFGK